MSSSDWFMELEDKHNYGKCEPEKCQFCKEWKSDPFSNTSRGEAA